MAERSDEQTVDLLLKLENEGQADQRAELTGQRFLSLIQDPETGRSYVIRHGLDDTEGAEVPEDTEFWEYDTARQAERAYAELLGEARAAGELVELDSEEDLGDSETAGAEVLDRYSAVDEDPLVVEDADDRAAAPEGSGEASELDEILEELPSESGDEAEPDQDRYVTRPPA